jgi:hypothetical protein
MSMCAMKMVTPPRDLRHVGPGRGHQEIVELLSEYDAKSVKK